MNNNPVNLLEIKTLSYSPSLASQQFLPLESLPWSMLLKSASTTHVDSRFDILVAQPIATLTTSAMETKVTTPDGEFHSSDDPFALIKRTADKYLPNMDYQGELPFIGGALGYFGYDLGRRVEKMPQLALHDLATPDMMVGIYDWAIIVDHKLEQAFMVGVNLDEKQSWLSYLSLPNQQPFSLTGQWQSNMTPNEYKTKFDSVQEYLKGGDCYQINLAQRFTAGYQGSEWQAYQELEQGNKAPFSAFIRTEKGAILSVSPERFLQVKGKQVETKPIKGTRPRSSDPQLDRENAMALANAEKDQAENLMIVDLLRNDIGRVAKPGSVHVPKLFDIESFPAVHHLVSTIRAELDKQFHCVDLLRASFPGGSITGAPKVRAMEIIEELEPHRRNAYCGSIGYISAHGQMDTSITIRTLVAEAGKLHAWAGGGVVADSESDSEYQETLDKLSRILPLLSRD
ncbi:aminodeoxychorismate synthase component 1 [Vibrio sonorensis]|uniref:aminodeoxychorismate synthase component 1 n=1 Tax=Vibrio sonorensis TaxID=1004316 RepID=UPI0008D9B6C1|nr:aminodeoxychorismate synthase component 1 [Vibrio sonorensis]